MGIRQSVNSVMSGQFLRSRWFRIAAISVAVSVVLLAAVNIYLANRVSVRLKAMVSESSKGLYRLEYSKVTVNALTGNIAIHQPELIPQNELYDRLLSQGVAPAFLVSGKTRKITVRNVRWLGYLANNNLIIGSISIRQPELTVHKYRQKDSGDRQFSLYSLISKHVKQFRLGKFSTENARVSYQVSDTAAGTRSINNIGHMDLEFSKITLGPKGNGEEDDRGLVASDYKVKLKDYRHRTNDSLYWIGIRGLQYHSSRKTGELDEFYVEPILSREQFSRRIGHQKSYYNIRLSDIEAKGFDLAKWVESGTIVIGSIKIDKGSANITMNRSLPPPPVDIKNVVLNQKVANISIPLLIRNIEFEDFDVRYTEDHSGRNAVLNFGDMKGVVKNITNNPEIIARNRIMTLSLQSDFVSTRLHADFEFDLSSTAGNFRSHLKIDKLNAESLNDILIPVAKIEARKGVLQELDAKVTGNANTASADVNLLYEGLKINVLKQEGDSLTTKGLKTMFANLFIEDDNPNDGNLRQARGITKQRKTGKSFLNLLWSSISGGMQQIILKKNRGNSGT